MNLKESFRHIVAWLERGTNRWLFVRRTTRALGHKSHARIRETLITRTTGASAKPAAMVGMQRRVEVWRPVKELVDEHECALDSVIVDGQKLVLVDVDDRFLDFNDLIVDAGLDALCGQAFDGSGSRPPVFNYVAIGTDGTAPGNGQTSLGAEVMRVQGTYAKDAAVGECSMDATFNMTGVYGLQECGLFSAASGGTMYCRDTYSVKNVVSGDTVKVYYTPKYQRPA